MDTRGPCSLPLAVRLSCLARLIFRNVLAVAARSSPASVDARLSMTGIPDSERTHGPEQKATQIRRDAARSWIVAVVAVLSAVAASLVIYFATLTRPQASQPTQIFRTRAAPLDADPVAARSPDPSSAVVMTAPRTERLLLDAHVEYLRDINAPNDLTEEEMRSTKSKAWKKAVLTTVRFSNWTAYTGSVEPNGRVELYLDKQLKFVAQIPPRSALFVVLKAIHSRGQLVRISGGVDEREVEAMQSDDDDMFFPTCFEKAFGFIGCRIELTNLHPA